MTRMRSNVLSQIVHTGRTVPLNVEAAGGASAAGNSFVFWLYPADLKDKKRAGDSNKNILKY